MIFYVTGILGAGKSYFGAKQMARALLTGKMVASNIRLVEGWERIVLGHAPYYKWCRHADKRREFEREILARYAHIPDMEYLISARLHGKGESRGIRVIDEAHNEINNREYMNANQKLILRRMALARKRGWDDYILAQSKDNTDAALRRISGVEVKLVNWRKLLILPFFHTELLPFNLFLAMAHPMNVSSAVRGEKKVLWRQLYKLGWEKNIYDTFEDFDIAGVDGEFEDGIWFPLPEKQVYNHNEHVKKRAAAREELAALSAELLGEGTPTSDRLPWSSLRASQVPPAPESSAPPSDESPTPTVPNRPATSGSEA